MTVGFSRRSRVDLAVCGLGYWGPKLLRNMLEMSGVTPVAACDARPEVLRRHAGRYPELTLTSAYDDLLEDPVVQGIVVATPASTHYELTRRALLAGKHVLVEKPLAADVAQGMELRDLAAERELVLMPGHTFLYSSAVLHVKELIDSGDLGRIHFATSSRVNLGVHQSDISVIRDLAPHDFSMLRHWFGRPSWVRAIGRDSVMRGVVDVAFVDVAFPDGCLVHVDLSWLAPTKVRRTVVVGENKMVVYEDTSPQPVRVFDRGIDRVESESFGEFQLAYRSGDIVTPELDPVEPLRRELEDFAACIRSGERPRSDVALGLEVLEMLAAADESLARGGTVVELPAEGVGASVGPTLASARTA
jgi:predicted dehydrogenase